MSRGALAARVQIAVGPAEGGAEKLLTHFASGYLYRPLWATGGDELAFSAAGIAGDTDPALERAATPGLPAYPPANHCIEAAEPVRFSR